jgi:hypothetical protein
LGATRDSSVKVTVRALMDRLGIAGFGTALERLRDAEACGFLILMHETGGYGATSARYYRIGKPSKTIETDLKTNPLGNVFPKPETVEWEFLSSLSVSSGPPGNNEKAGTTEKGQQFQEATTANCSPPEMEQFAGTSPAPPNCSNSEGEQFHEKTSTTSTDDDAVPQNSLFPGGPEDTQSETPDEKQSSDNKKPWSVRL